MTRPNPYEMMQEALEAMLVFCHPGNPKHIAARAALAESRKWEAHEGGSFHYGGSSPHHPEWSFETKRRREDAPAILLVRK